MRALASEVNPLSEQSRDKILRQRRPRAVDPFAAVEGVFANDALTPPVDALGMNRDQQNAAAVEPAKARLKEMDERQVNFAERDGFNLHKLDFRYRSAGIPSTSLRTGSAGCRVGVSPALREQDAPSASSGQGLATAAEARPERSRRDGGATPHPSAAYDHFSSHRPSKYFPLPSGSRS